MRDMERLLFLFLGLIGFVAGLYFAVYYGALLWLEIETPRALEFVILNVGLVCLSGFLVVRGFKKPKVKRKMM